MDIDIKHDNLVKMDQKNTAPRYVMGDLSAT